MYSPPRIRTGSTPSPTTVGVEPGLPKPSSDAPNLSASHREGRHCPSCQQPTAVDVTPYSRSTRTPSRRNRGRAILSAGGVCPDSALHWWRRLLRVFPAGDSEPGGVFGPITGDPDPVPPRRDRVVPACNPDGCAVHAGS